MGIGADGVLVLDQSKTCDHRMRIINDDGSEAEMCGKCHTDLTTHYHPVSSRRPDPRTGQPMRCSSCHKPHAAELAKGFIELWGLPSKMAAARDLRIGRSVE